MPKQKKESDDDEWSGGGVQSKGAEASSERESVEIILNHEETNKDNAQPSNEMEVSEPVKRKRGRPKKGEVVIKAAKPAKKARISKAPKEPKKREAKTNEDKEDDDNSFVQEEGETKEQRLKGKSQTEGAETSDSEEGENTSFQGIKVEIEETVATQPVQWKRGRPKKGEIRIKKPKYVKKIKPPKDPNEPKGKKHRLLDEDDAEGNEQANQSRIFGTGKWDQNRVVRNLNLWSQHPHYRVIDPVDVELEGDYLHFRNLMQADFSYSCASISDWMQTHGFDQLQTLLLPVNINITGGIKQIRLPAYDGDCVGNDQYLNSSCPISSIAGIAFNDTNFLAVGGTRIGWPNHDIQLDYEACNSHEDRNLMTITQETGFATDFIRGVAEVELHDNHLQVWSVDKPAKLEYFVELPKRGSVVKVLRAAVDLTAINSLGLITILYGNGQVDVLLLPHPKLLPTCASDEPMVCAVQSLLISQIHFNDVMITAISWNPNDPFELCCGQSDGSCSLWSVKQACMNGTGQAQLLMRLQDSWTDPLVTASNAVLAVAISAHFPQYIATGGLFGSLKIWSRNEPSIPVAVKPATCGIAAIQWDVTGSGLFWTDLENTVVSLTFNTIIYLLLLNWVYLRLL